MSIRNTVLFFLAFFLVHAAQANGANFPAGFVEKQVTGALNRPTVMQFAPDGRLFVCEQEGTIRVIKDDVMLPTPLLTIPDVNMDGERGLMGIAFDPAFTQNGYIYAYFTAETPFLHNRLSRFTVSGDEADVSSELRLLEMDDMRGASFPWHVGGALNFGADGNLYVLTGDNTEPEKAQSLTSVFGKVLRIKSDGSIPTDNPFYAQTEGIHRAIWALGLRNPFTGTVQPGSGMFLVNDVGNETWEEINEAAPGANFGWPDAEGATSDPRFTSPIYAYIHNGADCAITGSAFYNPDIPTFPSRYDGKYFFADYCSGWIRILDPQSRAVEDFATSVGDLTDLKVSPSGSLYYIRRSEGSIVRVDWSESGLPVITTAPADVTVTVGGTAIFSCTASGDGPLTIEWQRDESDIPGATGETLTLFNVQLADTGSRFRCRVSNANGSAISADATLVVTTNQAPLAVIVTPVDGSFFKPGDVIPYAGYATDSEDGALSAVAFTWQVDLGHGTGAEAHVHPLVPPTTGSMSGEIVATAAGHSSRDIYYQFRLTVTDSSGATTTVISRKYPAPIDVPGELEAEDAAGSSGLPAPTGRRLMSAGDFVQDRFSFPHDGLYRFSIKAAGDFADREWPQALLKIDGSAAGSVTVDSADVTEFVIAAPVPAGSHTVAVEFPNDFWDGVNDRNLFIDSFSIVPLDGGETSNVYSVRSLLAENRFMDVSGEQQDAGTAVIIWQYHGNVNQRFEFRSSGEIVVYGSMCLSTRTPGGESGDEVVIEPCTGQPNQTWTTTAAGEIRGIGDRCLDVWRELPDPGTKLIVYTCHGGINQKWEMIPSEP